MITMCKGCHANEQLRLNPGLKLANAFGVIPTDSTTLTFVDRSKEGTMQVEGGSQPSAHSLTKKCGAIFNVAPRKVGLSR